MFDLFAQAVPNADLPTEWATWIILTLLGFIGSVFLFAKWLIGLGSRKVDSFLTKIDTMHTAGISELRQIKESQIKTEKDIVSIDKRITENRDAIHTLASKIHCKESD